MKVKNVQKINGSMLYTKLKHKTRVLRELEKLGVVSPTWLRDVEIFERFHLWPELEVYARYELLAEEYGFKNPVSIKKIIEKLSQN